MVTEHIDNHGSQTVIDKDPKGQERFHACMKKLSLFLGNKIASQFNETLDLSALVLGRDTYKSAVKDLGPVLRVFHLSGPSETLLLCFEAPLLRQLSHKLLGGIDEPVCLDLAELQLEDRFVSDTLSQWVRAFFEENQIFFKLEGVEEDIRRFQLCFPGDDVLFVSLSCQKEPSFLSKIKFIFVQKE